MYITICKIDSWWEFAVCLRKLKHELCINLEGWDGERDRREVQKGGHVCMPIADSCWGLAENNKILQSNCPSIKKLINLKKKELFSRHSHPIISSPNCNSRLLIKAHSRYSQKRYLDPGFFHENPPKWGIMQNRKGNSIPHSSFHKWLS